MKSRAQWIFIVLLAIACGLSNTGWFSQNYRLLQTRLRGEGELPQKRALTLPPSADLRLDTIAHINNLSRTELQLRYLELQKTAAAEHLSVEEATFLAEVLKYKARQQDPLNLGAPALDPELPQIEDEAAARLLDSAGPQADMEHERD